MKVRMAGVLVVGALGLVAGFGGAGCKETKDFPVVASRTAGAPESMGTAGQEGDYLLYRTDKMEVVARNHLKAGEPLGFKADARDLDNKLVGSKGQVSAIAGDLVVPLNQGLGYEWRMVPGSQKVYKQENDWWPRP